MSLFSNKKEHMVATNDTLPKLNFEICGIMMMMMMMI